MVGLMTFSNDVTRCAKCRASGEPTWAPAKAGRLPLVSMRREPDEGPGLHRFEKNEVAAGFACGQCPDVEHLHWECTRCMFVWLSATSDAKS